MVELRAGWAVVGTPPGSAPGYDAGHTVLAASAEPFTEHQVERIAEHCSPGSSHQAETGAAALPWLWQFCVALHGKHYLCVALRDWSDELDAYRRPTARTRFAFVPLEEFAGAGARLHDLMTAVAADLPPWDGGPTRLDHDHRPLVLRGESAPSPLPLRAAATLAAAVVDSRIALGGGRDLSIGVRLGVLDSVRDLLPAGAVSWLSLAGWAYGDNTIQLGFSENVRRGILPVPLHDIESTPLSPAAARYRDTLLRLCASVGHRQVVEHLRTQVGTLAQDFGAVEASLAAIDPTTAAGFLRQAEPGKLLDDERVLTELRRPDRKALITEALVAGLTTKGWTGPQVVLFADLAEQVGALPQFAAGLRVTGSTPDAVVDVVEQVVLARAQRKPWRRVLAGVVADSGELSLRLARLRGAGTPVGPKFFEQLDSLGPDTHWTRAGQVVAGEREPVPLPPPREEPPAPDLADLAGLAGIRASARPSAAASAIAELAVHPRPHPIPSLAEALCEGTWRPADSQWVDLVEALHGELTRRHHSAVDQFCARFTEEVFTRMPRGAALALLPRLVTRARVLDTAIGVLLQREPEAAEGHEDALRGLRADVPRPLDFRRSLFGKR